MSFFETKHNPKLDRGVKDVNGKRSTFQVQGGKNGPPEPGSVPPHGGKKFPPIPSRPPNKSNAGFDSVESIPKGGGPPRPPQLSKIGEASNGSPRLGMYYKNTNTSTGSVGNGTANASVRVQKIKRQNSMGTFGRAGSFTSDDVDTRPGTIVDQEKIDAAKKRLLEAKLKKAKGEASAKRTWKQRFKWCGTTLVSLTIVLSSSSLLFIVPIVVDPIFVGLGAQFSSKPVRCRTVSFENETGPMNCAMPSCREGCTADLYACVFVSVIYTKENVDVFNNSTLIPDSPFGNQSENTFFNATLFVNPSGCGYPPDVNCSVFEKNYQEIGTEFPCYYSSTNSSLVVPFYSRHDEFVNLGFALGIPFGLLFLATATLFLLLRWDLNRVQDISQDEITDEELEAWGVSNSKIKLTEKLTYGSTKHPGYTPNTNKLNGHGPKGYRLDRDDSKSMDSSFAKMETEVDPNKYHITSMMNGVA